MSKTQSKISNPTISYIVISDLHLGEVDSLFTPRNSDNFEIIEAFSKALAAIIVRFNQDNLPKLILNGDILGLSFSDYKTSLILFEAFLKACTINNVICDTIIYIPGNHDHHIWSLAKEHHFLENLKNVDSLDKMGLIESVTPPTFPNGFDSSFLDSFAKRINHNSLTFKIFYPNFILPSKQDGEPFVLIHHGHFSENTYHFTSKFLQAFYPELDTPDTLNELEAQNGAFIDFAFSELGRSGNAGQFFEKLMATLSDEKLLKEHIDELSENIARNVDFPYLPVEWMEKKLAQTLLEDISKKVRSERYKGNATCSDETLKGLLHYLNTYCSETLKENGWTNEAVSLIWGHTHKPFQKKTKTEHFSNLNIFNSGGWVLPKSVTPLIGSSVLFVSDANETQSLRIFNDAKEGGEMHFEILEEEGFSETDFSKKINSSIRGESGMLYDEWESLKSKLIAEITKRRHENR